MTTDATNLRRFDCEDGSFNLLLPFTPAVAHGHVASGWRPSTTSAPTVELGAGVLSGA